MCEPTTIAIGLTLASAAYTGYSQREAGKANQKIAENNARLSNAQAEAASAMGDRESQQQTWRTRAILGQQRVAVASRGIDAGIGTPAEIMGETALFGEVDQQAIRINAAQRAWGFNAQAEDFRNQGRQARWQGNSQASGTILSGLAQAGGQYMAYYGGNSAGTATASSGKFNKKGA